MAVQCPACERIHFETNSTPIPAACVECGAALAAPVVPPTPAPQPGTAGGGASKPFLFAGIAVLCAAGWLLLTGVAEREKYEPATATVKSSSNSKVVERQRRSSGDWVRYQTDYRVEVSYVANGKRYAMPPGGRWVDGQTFTVWYRAESPEVATERRPFAKLLGAVGLMAVGLFLFGLAFGVFGGVAEAVADGLARAAADADRPLAPVPPAAAPPGRWFADANRRRIR